MAAACGTAQRDQLMYPAQQAQRDQLTQRAQLMHPAQWAQQAQRFVNSLGGICEKSGLLDSVIHNLN